MGTYTKLQKRSLPLIYIHVGKGHTHMNTEATESEQTCKVYFHTYKFKIENVDTRSHTLLLMLHGKK